MLVAGTVILTLVLAAPAGAGYVRDLQVNEMTTPFGSDNRKKVQLPCLEDRTNKLPIGTGASAKKSSKLAINKLWVYSMPPVILSSASETDPLPEGRGWDFTAQAFCVRKTDLPPSLGPGPNYLKDVLISRSSFKASDRNNDSSKSRQVSCVPPRVAIGGGFEIDEPAPEKTVAAQSVLRLNTGFRVAAQETDLTRGRNWGVAPYAICANVTNAASTSAYVGTPTLVFVSSQGSSGDPKIRTAKCPPGQFVIGGGAQVRDSNDRPPENVVLAASRPVSPNPAFAHFFSTEWYARAVEVDPVATFWQLQVRAVCAPREPFR